MRMFDKASTMPSTPSFSDTRVLPLWQQLDCRLPGVDAVFEDCARHALGVLDAAQLERYIEAGRTLGKLGRGAAPVLTWLQAWPDMAQHFDDVDEVMALVRRMHKSPNSAAISPLLNALAPVARRLGSAEGVRQYLHLLGHFMDQTTGSIHGRQQTLPSPGLPHLIEHSPHILQSLSLMGLQNWVSYGARAYANHPPQQTAYFSLQTPDSRAVLQRERHGLLLVDVDRVLGMSLRAMWHIDLPRVPYNGIDAHTTARPCLQDGTLGLPDVLDDLGLVSAMQRYQLMQAHLAAHVRWSTPSVADNWSPAQRMAVEWFEDARVDHLMLQKFPGLRSSLLALHPRPSADECDDTTQACLIHRLSRWSCSVFDPSYRLNHPTLEKYRDLFLQIVTEPNTRTSDMALMALRFVANTRQASDQFADVYFGNTELDWRDDNRHLWRFIEDGDEEDTRSTPSPQEAADLSELPPRHYPEWDYVAQTYRPDWVSVYEHLHPSGRASDIEALLAKQEPLARQLKRILDSLKPQHRQRLRFQEQGNELDLDIALNAWIEMQNGQPPSERIHQHHQTCGRDISVQVLLDLSASLRTRVPGGDQTILQLSQEAVSLLGWAMHTLGDSFAIAGFHSNTRHEVRYLHIKGFSESWGDVPKARLAAMEPGYSTRMGAALRHAAHYLGARQSEKKLMLVITDGEPSDVDSPDGQWLVQDARKAVQELQAEGIYTWCINLDAQADDTVREVYGARYTIVDHLEKLPSSLAQLFLSLTAR